MSSITTDQKRRVTAPVPAKDVGGVLALAGMIVLIGGYGSREHVEVIRSAAAARTNERLETAGKERTKPRIDEKIAALIETIDDDPDEAHIDYTPAVHRLIDIGPRAIEPLLELMVDDSRYPNFTRMHAETAIRRILAEMHGFRAGQGWPNPDGVRVPEGEQRFLDLWDALGDLDWDTPLIEREQSVRKWREWLAEGAPVGPPGSSSGSGESANR